MALPEAVDIMRVWPMLSAKRRKEVSALMEKMGWAPREERPRRAKVR